MAWVEAFPVIAFCPFLGRICFLYGIVLFGGEVGGHVFVVSTCQFAAGKAIDIEYTGGNGFHDVALQVGLVVRCRFPIVVLGSGGYCAGAT